MLNIARTFERVFSRLVHYHNALRRMLGSSEVRSKASLDAGKNEMIDYLKNNVCVYEFV
jgi:hypothetical protein